MKERPSDEIMRALEKERQLSGQELELLEQSAAVDARARAVRKELDEVRVALQALSGTSARGQAELLFLDLVACAVPPYHATRETALALEQRKKAAAARRQAVLAETTVIGTRSQQVDALAATVAAARNKAVELSSRVAVELPHPAAPVETPTAEASAAPAAPVPTAAPAPASPDGPPPSQAGAQAGARMKTRVHKRVRLERKLTMTSPAGTFIGFCRNISVGGLFITTYDSFLPSGTRVELTLTLDGPPIRIAGVIRFVRKTGDTVGMGVEFEDNTPDIDLTLYTFMNRQEAEFWEPEE
jgi:uncharacterized protein (TIGR02266 family)